MTHFKIAHCFNLLGAVFQSVVNHEISDVCDVVPSYFRSTCDNYLDSLDSKIMNSVEQEFNASKICSFLGFCSSSIDLAKLNSVKPKKPTQKL